MTEFCFNPTPCLPTLIWHYVIPVGKKHNPTPCLPTLIWHYVTPVGTAFT